MHDFALAMCGADVELMVSVVGFLLALSWAFVSASYFHKLRGYIVFMVLLCLSLIYFYLCPAFWFFLGDEGYFSMFTYLQYTGCTSLAGYLLWLFLQKYKITNLIRVRKR
jgi:ABC-type branched-subunit amino acid transport system permease subunit